MNPKLLLAVIAIFGLNSLSLSLNVLKMFPEFGQLKQEVQTNKQSAETAIKSIQSEITILKQPKPACQFGLFHLYGANGVRDKEFSYTFSPAFADKPAVVWGYEHLDISNSDNIRLSVNVLEYTRFKLRLSIYTWETSKLFGATLRWMACPKTI